MIEAISKKGPRRIIEVYEWFELAWPGGVHVVEKRKRD